VALQHPGPAALELVSFHEYVLRLGVPRGLTDRYLRDAVATRPALERYPGWLRGEAWRGNPRDIAFAGRALATFDARPFAGAVDVPTTVVVTTRDHLVGPSRQQELAAPSPVPP